ncbi:MAG TPA: low-complexity protein [Methylophaga aminisulfidivorans]|uniref:Low-complexity protein n=2 Tax=root TaxID=1 RepID=A0A7C1ZRA3_9GAMM|nr:low-complexity protein [Methylophaga sp.]HEC73765.1 low-complexity protein [Methylophaga aminisulfidivorans]
MSNSKTTIALAATAAMTAGLALAPTLASADSNPFSSVELSSGYMQLAEHHAEEGKCGEVKCGADKKAEEAKCGADKKAAESKCGAEKKAAESKCGADKKMDEGKCGSNK